jgi:hypothetical protein
MAAKDPPKSTFNSWYIRHSAKYNKSRSKRYKTDAEFREKARANAAAYRESVKEKGIQIKKTPAGRYSSAVVAGLLDVSTQTLRNWELRGRIPVAVYGGKKREYTPAQLKLIRASVEADRKGCPDAERVRAVMFAQWDDSRKG